MPSWFAPGWGGGKWQCHDWQLLRPFPQFGHITTNCCLENLGQSTYNALQTKLERRLPQRVERIGVVHLFEDDHGCGWLLSVLLEL